MSQIQWYPGHMAKSFRELDKNLRQVEIVMILLDARIPMSSMNPEILRRLHNKPVLILFNKQDLADRKILSLWEDYYRQSGYYTLSIDATSPQSLRSIYPLVKDVILKEQVERNLRRGRQLAPFKTMILGIPNVGKSTLINKLSGRKAASVANRPGHTKNQQYINVDRSFILIDTPGILPPNYENKNYIHNLALLGTIREEILPIETLSVDLATFLLDKYYPLLQTRYDLKEKINNPHELFISIAKRRGILGDELEVVNRTQSLLLTEFRNGLIGPISLETPHEK